jgi:uncharacterized protein (TIGR00304 family)
MDANVRPVRLLGPALLVLGIAVLVLAFLQGEASLALFIIFPVITATGGWAILGILLVVAGFFLSFLTWPGRSADSTLPEPSPAAPPPGGTPASASEPSPHRRWGGVVFLGPVPIVFGSDQKVTLWMLILGVVLFVAFVVFTVIALRGI